MANSNYHKEFGNILENLNPSLRLYDKFFEFCKVSTYSMAAVFYPQLAKEKIGALKLTENKDKLHAYQQCFDILVEALEASHNDFLGSFFEMSDMGNARNGQFFTPYHLSLMCAKMQITGTDEIIKKRGFITVSEPACGAGGMIIAVRQVLLESGFNPSVNMYAELTDVDELCFYMAYIQTSLYGLAARVIHGDTISMKIFQELYTPVYFFNKFPMKLALDDMSNMLICSEDANLHEEESPIIIPEPIVEDCGQYRLAL